MALGTASEALSLELTQIRVESPAEGVVVVSLDNAGERNSMSLDMTASWERVMTSLAADGSVRAVVVTGEGAAFCSGGNLGWLASDGDASVEALRAKLRGFYRSWLTVREIKVPTIAAINGAAVGAGLAIALACDIRYAAASARMSAPFVKLGLHPGMATTFSLADVVGPAAARDLLLTGRAVEGDEALRLGLVSRLFDPAELLDGAIGAATAIAASAPLASRLTKQTLLAAGFAEGLEREAQVQPITMASADFAEGIAAARERRAPEFKGV